MFITDKISFHLNGKKIINEMSYSFEKGKIYALLGLNGSGKSTLLKIFSGIWNQNKGDLFWNSINLQTLSRFKRSQIVTLIQQNPLITFEYTVEEIVHMGAFLNNNYVDKNECVVNSLAMVDALHLAKRPITQLSGGERQRVFIARAFAVGSEILLLDEPTSFLDIKHKKKIWSLIDEYSSKKIIIISTHDFEMAEKYCDQGILLDGKGNVFYNEIKNIIHSPIFQNQ